jgi:hypothetical protein
MYAYYHTVLMLVQGSLLPWLFQGVYSLCFSISASLSCLWFVQGSLFPLFSIQQACLDYGLFKGLCSLYYGLYNWSPAYFRSILFLHLIKKRRASRNSWKILITIQRSDQKSWPVRTITLAWHDQTSSSPSVDSTSTPWKWPSGNSCKI